MENKELFTFNIDRVTRTELTGIMRWTRFLSLLGMIVLVLGLFATVLGATVITTGKGIDLSGYGESNEQIDTTLRISMIVSTVLFCLVLFFPLYYLFLFSGRLKKALATHSQQELVHAFFNLKKYFRYLAILIICAFIIYGLAIVFRFI